MTDIVIKTVEELKDAPEEYREAVSKLVISHAINELYGAQVFDEPAIAYAPTPYAKWLTCRVAMEEYGHHVRFKQLGAQMGIPEERMIPGTGKKPLSIFEFPLKTWEEFVAIKLLAAWMACAKAFLPLPASPVMRTRASLAAAICAWPRRCSRSTTASPGRGCRNAAACSRTRARCG